MRLGRDREKEGQRRRRPLGVGACVENHSWARAEVSAAASVYPSVVLTFPLGPDRERQDWSGGAVFLVAHLRCREASGTFDSFVSVF